MLLKQVIGAQTLIKKMWVKFDGMDVDCICDEHHRKCRDEKCKEYVVKFTEVDRKKEIPNIDISREEADLRRAIRKLKKSETELSKSMRKFKGFKIK
jgi:hypothetical protein